MGKKRTVKPMESPAMAGTIIHVFSDSTGNLVQHMLSAFLTQFPPGSFRTRFWTFIRTTQELEQALAGVAEQGGIIMHAIVSADAKERIAQFCRERRVSCKDLTGGFIEFLAEASGLTPSDDWRDLHRVDEAYHSRIKAMEFTLAHDDGLGLETLHEADAVLVGVSRTSKTPTSIYLSQMGYRAANVSLASGVEPPREVLELAPGKAVGLIVDPTRLVEIRRRRQADWSMGSTNYDAVDCVRDELAWSRRLFSRQGWPVIDVSTHAIEETAARIIELLKLPRVSGI